MQASNNSRADQMEVEVKASSAAAAEQKAEVKEEKERKIDQDEVQGLDADAVMEDEIQVKLFSKEKQSIMVRKKDTVIVNLIKTSFEQDPSATELPLPGVTFKILELVVSYMQHHRGVEPPLIPKPLREKEMSKVCSDVWDAKFIDDIGERRQDLYDLILAANYLDIKSLLHLGCAKVASLIKGQPLEKIKEILSRGTLAEEKRGKENKSA